MLKMHFVYQTNCEMLEPQTHSLLTAYAHILSFAPIFPTLQNPSSFCKILEPALYAC